MEVKQRSLTKRHFFLLAALLSVLIAAGGYLYLQNRGRTIRTEKHAELRAISELKIDQFNRWRKERIADAHVLSREPIVVHGIETWLSDRKNNRLQKEIETYLVVPQQAYNYENIFIASVKGELLLSAGRKLFRIDSVASGNIRKTVNADGVYFSDFYRDMVENAIHYDISIPINNEKNRTIAVLVLRINPFDYLYPLIQSWPTPSKSSETLLARREGDSVMFLNDLRFRTGAALSFKIPIQRKEVPVVQAVLGREGFFEGTDYRGVQVLSDIRHVPGTQWLIVAKIDRDEIYSDLERQTVTIIVFTCLLMLVCGIGVMGIYHYRQRNFYKTLWHAQEEFRTTLYSIGDAVITTDKEGRVQQVNNVAAQLTGWNEDQAKNRLLEDIFHIINEETRASVANPVQRVLAEGRVVGLANHTILIAKDGKEIPIADSGSPIRDDKNDITGIVLVFRDQTIERKNRKRLQDSETKFRRLFEAARDGILIVDADTGKILDANQFMIDMLGYSHEQFIGKNIWDLGFFKDIIANAEKFLELQQRKYVRYDDLPLETSDGRKIDVEFVSNVYLVDRRKIVQCNIRDISARKRTEQDLRESETRLSEARKMAQLGHWVWDVKTGAVEWSEEVYKIFQLDPETFTPKINSILDLSPWPEDHERDKELIRKTIESREKGDYEQRFLRPDNSIGYYYSTFQGRYDAKGDLVFIVGTVQDITERKQVEAALAEETIRRRILFEQSADGIVIIDPPTARIIEFNTAAHRQLGYSREEFAKLNIKDIEVKETLEGTRAMIARTIRERRIDFETLQRTKDGDIRNVYVTAQFIDIQGHPVYQCIWRDITDRKRAETALQESEVRFRSLYENTTIGLYRTTPDGIILMANPALVKMLGYSSFTNLSERNLEKEGFESSDQRRDFIEKIERDGEIYGYESKWIRRDGTAIYVLESARAIRDARGGTMYYDGTVEDITEHKRMEEQVKQLQKLEGLGTLASGIAHDFNNILGIILGYATGMKWFREDTKHFDSSVEIIIKAVERGKSLVHQILTFASKSNVEFVPVNVNSIVVEILTMVSETFPKVITYSRNIDAHLPFIQADRSQIHQALLNLFVNARDAMPDGGVLTINTRMISGISLRDQHPDAKASGYVCVEISDTGEGMTEEIRSRIFEPFFTTKEKGKGTGLGLSVVFGVIQSHKGFINVESKPGKGTTFRFYLPSTLASEPVGEKEEENDEYIPGGTETIMVVEDEENIMEPLLAILIEKGYTVLPAQNGLEAITIYEEAYKKISLVLTDLGLPKMAGLDVCKEIKNINPDARIIVATGFLDPGMKSDLVNLGLHHYLYKPYNFKEALNMMRNVMDEN